MPPGFGYLTFERKSWQKNLWLRFTWSMSSLRFWTSWDPSAGFAQWRFFSWLWHGCYGQDGLLPLEVPVNETYQGLGNISFLFPVRPCWSTSKRAIPPKWHIFAGIQKWQCITMVYEPIFWAKPIPWMVLHALDQTIRPRTIWPTAQVVLINENLGQKPSDI